jgi:hypothetical protein
VYIITSQQIANHTLLTTDNRLHTTYQIGYLSGDDGPQRYSGPHKIYSELGYLCNNCTRCLAIYSGKSGRVGVQAVNTRSDNSVTIHFWTHVVIPFLSSLYMRNPFLKFYR